MPPDSRRTDRITGSRGWGVRQSLVMTTLQGSTLLGLGQLRFSGSGLGVTVIHRRGDEADLAIEIAADAALGPRSLIVTLDGSTYEFDGVFTVVAPGGTSYSGPAGHGIGSHLL